MNEKLTQKQIRQSAIKTKIGKNQWYVSTWSDRFGMYIHSPIMPYSKAVAVVRHRRELVAEGHGQG